VFQANGEFVVNYAYNTIILFRGWGWDALWDVSVCLCRMPK